MNLGKVDHLTRRQFLGRVGSLSVGALALATGASPSTAVAHDTVATPASSAGTEVPVAWFHLLLSLIRDTPGFSPPVASRAIGYAGVTLYEAVVPGMPDSQSLAGQLNDLAAIPAPRDRAYHWPAVANRALAAMLRQLFPTAPASHRAAITALEETFTRWFQASVPAGILERSVRRGDQVATHIFDWSRTDGGHEGDLRNFPSDYTPPKGPGFWVPTPPDFSPALQPSWGRNRPFALASEEECDPGPPVPYSIKPTSKFYAEAWEVYDVVNHLSPAQREIALFWADNPGTTATPAGHSLSILNQILRSQGTTLAIAAEAYAKLGIAVADAFISCWSTKYRTNVLRPITFIQRHIDRQWGDALPVATPPFPEYTSGHSVQSGAAATVLTGLFGDRAFTDHTHDELGFAPRSFRSFDAFAEEAAISRLYGGIHYRTCIERGLSQGVCIGRKVSRLRFRS